MKRETQEKLAAKAIDAVGWACNYNLSGEKDGDAVWGVVVTSDHDDLTDSVIMLRGSTGKTLFRLIGKRAAFKTGEMVREGYDGEGNAVEVIAYHAQPLNAVTIRPEVKRFSVRFTEPREGAAASEDEDILARVMAKSAAKSTTAKSTTAKSTTAKSATAKSATAKSNTGSIDLSTLSPEQLAAVLALSGEQ